MNPYLNASKFFNACINLLQSVEKENREHFLWEYIFLMFQLKNTFMYFEKCHFFYTFTPVTG